MSSDKFETWTELYSKHKEEIDEEWHETFDELVGRGKSPSGIKATIEYCTSPKTQEQISREYDVSKPTIRKLKPPVVSLGPISSEDEIPYGGSTVTISDYCDGIIECLDWDEGVEYAATRPITIRKEGWKSLYEAIVNQDDDQIKTETEP